jgi:hypothetical protein
LEFNDHLLRVIATAIDLETNFRTGLRNDGQQIDAR